MLKLEYKRQRLYYFEYLNAVINKCFIFCELLFFSIWFLTNVKI